MSQTGFTGDSGDGDSGNGDPRTFIQAMVLAHYSTDGAPPLLLSQLGHRLDRAGKQLPEGVKLRGFIERELHDTLRIVRGSRTEHAVALLSDAVEVESQLQEKAKTAKQEGLLQKLPRSLLVAFCKAVDPGEKVFIHQSPPHRYRVALENPGPDFFEIEDEFRLPGKYIGRGVHLPPDLREDLGQRVANWLSSHSLEASSFFKKETSERRGARTALQRLIDAQPEEVRSQMLIPADIAGLLLKHE